MKFLNIILILFSVLSYAQQNPLLGDLRLKSSVFTVKSFDKSNLNVYYRFSFLRSNSVQSSTNQSICILQIGDFFSKFSDLSSLKLDSLRDKYSRQDFVNSEDMNTMLKYKVLWSNTSLKNLKENTITYQSRIKRLYEYGEEIPLIKWKLENGNKIILDYNCKKAVGVYRGRKYTAWYSSKISLNNGPYIFQGLPGLILEIVDENNLFHFKAEAIDKKTGSIYLEDEKQVLKVSREKFREIKKNYYDNPAAFHGKAYNEDGTQMISKRKNLNQVQMERE